MTHHESRISPTSERQWMLAWGHVLQLYGCTHCQSVMLSNRPLAKTCPYCFHDELVEMAETPDRPVYVFPPEAYVPHSARVDVIKSNLREFASDIPLAPRDLNVKQQMARMRKVFVPMWWVDAELEAHWQADVAFPYEVLSHEETYRAGRWQSREVQEERLRWEWRGGRMTRRYDNLQTAALTYFTTLETQLGGFQTGDAHPYDAKIIQDTVVILPDHSPQDAWREVRYELDQIAQEECKEAAEGKNIRHFLWEPSLLAKNWTHLLLPLYLSYYEDDQGQRQPIYIHGQSGDVIGKRMASQKRAVRRTWWYAAFALIAMLGLVLLYLLVPLVDTTRIPLLFLLGIVSLMLAWQAIRTIPRVRAFNAREGRGFLWGS